MTELTNAQQEELMREALKEADAGMQSGEVPIGCVLAQEENGELKIVGRGFNKVNAMQRKTAHAEMIAFENAAKTLPMDAENVILVSTLEPCVMCLGAAMEGGVATVIFGLEAPADNGTQRVKPPESPESVAPKVTGGILADESRQMFEDWLAKNKETPQAEFVKQLMALTKSR